MSLERASLGVCSARSRTMAPHTALRAFRARRYRVPRRRAAVVYSQPGFSFERARQTERRSGAAVMRRRRVTRSVTVARRSLGDTQSCTHPDADPGARCGWCTPTPTTTLRRRTARNRRGDTRGAGPAASLLRSSSQSDIFSHNSWSCATLACFPQRPQPPARPQSQNVGWALHYIAHSLTQQRGPRLASMR